MRANVMANAARTFRCTHAETFRVTAVKSPTSRLNWRNTLSYRGKTARNSNSTTGHGRAASKVTARRRAGDGSGLGAADMRLVYRAVFGWTAAAASGTATAAGVAGTSFFIR